MTDRKKLGDGVDMMLHFAGIAKARGELDVVSDYPETVQSILKLFIKVWGIQEYSVPRKPKSGKGVWAEWVSELSALESVCGKNVEKSLSDALEFYNESRMNFMITRPRSILNVVLEVKRRKQLEENKLYSKVEVPAEEKKDEKYVGGDEIERIRKELFGE